MPRAVQVQQLWQIRMHVHSFPRARVVREAPPLDEHSYVLEGLSRGGRTTVDVRFTAGVGGRGDFTFSARFGLARGRGRVRRRGAGASTATRVPGVAAASAASAAAAAAAAAAATLFPAATTALVYGDDTLRLGPPFVREHAGNSSVL